MTHDNTGRTVAGNISLSLDGRVSGPGGGLRHGMDRHPARWLNDVEKIVFSTTLTLADWKNSRIADTDPVAVVNELRKTDSGAIRVYYDRKPT